MRASFYLFIYFSVVHEHTQKNKDTAAKKKKKKVQKDASPHSQNGYQAPEISSDNLIRGQLT